MRITLRQIAKDGMKSIRGQIKNAQYERTPTELTFNSQSYEDWFHDYVKCRLAGPSSEDYSNFIVRQVDYLVNPSILHKNQNILTLLLQNIFPKLETKEKLFKDVTKKLEDLVNNSYKYDEIQCDTQIIKFFGQEQTTKKKTSIFIHEQGYKQTIKEGTDYVFNQIYVDNYAGSPFKEVTLKDLPEQMPRID